MEPYASTVLRLLATHPAWAIGLGSTLLGILVLPWERVQ